MLDHDGRLPCLRWPLLFGRRRDHRHLGLPLSPTRSHGARRSAGSRASLGAKRGPARTAPSSKPRARKPAAGTKRLPSCAARGPAHTWSGGGLPGHNHSARGRGAGLSGHNHSARGWGALPGALPLCTWRRELQEAPDRTTRACGGARTRQLSNKPGFTQAFRQASIALNSLDHNIQTPPPAPWKPRPNPKPNPQPNSVRSVLWDSGN